MQQSTLTKLALLVFGLVFVSFIVRGFGQVVVGARVATMVAGPLAVLAGLVLLLVVALWLFGRVGLLAIEPPEATDRQE